MNVKNKEIVCLEEKNKKQEKTYEESIMNLKNEFNVSFNEKCLINFISI